jgi:hypothetical protein
MEKRRKQFELALPQAGGQGPLRSPFTLYAIRLQEEQEYQANVWNAKKGAVFRISRYLSRYSLMAQSRAG